MSEREQFEAWCKSKGAPKENWWVRQLDDGGYSCEPVDKAWEAWQARAQTAQAVPLLTEDEIAAALPHEPGDLDFVCARAIEAAVRAKLGVAVPMPPEDWSVFNTGAEVASGLTWAEAWDYMTPSRIERGWTAVCVANKSNIGIVGKEGA